MKKIKKEGLIIWASIFIMAQYILTFFIFNLTNRILLQALGWLVWLFSLLIYLDIQAADQQAIKKFGEPYRVYEDCSSS